MIAIHGARAVLTVRGGAGYRIGRDICKSWLAVPNEFAIAAFRWAIAAGVVQSAWPLRTSSSFMAGSIKLPPMGAEYASHKREEEWVPTFSVVTHPANTQDSKARQRYLLRIVAPKNIIDIDIVINIIYMQ